MGDSFCGFAHAFGVIEEAAFLRIVRVHPFENFAERRLAMTGIAHREVEHDTEQLALVVIGNAALGTAVVAIALKPGIEAGLFGGLREVRGAALEFRDSFAEPGEILLLIDQTGAQLNDAFDGAGDAFAEPQRPRVILFGVVDGFESLRANAFHIPEMEEFVRGDAGEGV